LLAAQLGRLVSVVIAITISDEDGVSVLRVDIVHEVIEIASSSQIANSRRLPSWRRWLIPIPFAIRLSGVDCMAIRAGAPPWAVLVRSVFSALIVIDMACGGERYESSLDA
jgi:hypothetical protein